MTTPNIPPNNPTTAGGVPPGPSGVPSLPAQNVATGGFPSVVVGTYPDYAQAQRAVDTLSDNKFPVERSAIIGTDLRLVENVLGRLTTGRAALAGAASGAWFGLFIGLLFGLFSTSSWFAVILVGLLIGAAWGAVFGAIANAIIGGDVVEPGLLTTAVHRIFIGMGLVAVVMVALAALIPRSADEAYKQPEPARAG